MKLKDFAGIVKGVIHGDPEINYLRLGIMDANEGDITFVSSAKYLKQPVRARHPASS